MYVYISNKHLYLHQELQRKQETKTAKETGLGLIARRISNNLDITEDHLLRDEYILLALFQALKNNRKKLSRRKERDCKV